MKTTPIVAALVGLVGCAASPPRLEEPARSRALGYARRADELGRTGDRRAALELATRALVVRLAACGYDCPDVAYSFVQLGDLRFQNGQPEHSAQSYARAIEVLEPHASTHRGWIDAVAARLSLACASASHPPPACRAAPLDDGRGAP